jgi:hypothetical protein
MNFDVIRHEKYTDYIRIQSDYGLSSWIHESETIPNGWSKMYNTTQEYRTPVRHPLYSGYVKHQNHYGDSGWFYINQAPEGYSVVYEEPKLIKTDSYDPRYTSVRIVESVRKEPRKMIKLIPIKRSDRV